ncbi:hypothetical protein [Parasediminibacterium sp. JCM 36343]|uniref:hypothetical protein n=1 Tax=Parasediminibacterium sp. JCM 36343 TaxID=3374279 RepID=UPI00397BB493
MKSLVKTAGFKTLSTLAVIVASQVGVFAANTSTNASNDSLSTGSALGLTALLVAAILIPASKSTKSARA